MILKYKKVYVVIDDIEAVKKGPANNRTKDDKVEKDRTKDGKVDDKNELNAEDLLKEMAEYKKDQERVLNEQKKILSELKQVRIIEKKYPSI